MKKIFILLLLAFLGVQSSKTNAQGKGITISGVVMDADSVYAMPYVNIRLKGTYFGTVSDSNGHFTFVASEGDTLQFSYVGYFEAYFIMPKLSGDSYSLIQLMRRETVMLDEVVIFPWPEYEQLKKAFLSTKPRRDIVIESKREVKRISIDEYQRNKYYYNVYHNNQLYDMTGIIPPNNFLNPINWSNFIKDVKNKKYDKEKK